MRINKDDNTIIDDNNQVIIRDIKAKKITVDQDLIMLKLGHKYSAFNINGNDIIPFNRESTSMHISHNLVAYKVNKTKWGVVDKNGNQILEEIYQKIIINKDCIYAKRGSYMIVYLHNGDEITKIKILNFYKVPWHQKDNGNIRVEIEEKKHLSIYEFCHLNHKILENSKVKIY